MEINEIISREFEQRVLIEGVERIKKCISYLSDEEIWTKPNSNSNSIGNLIVHLEGNVRQYILSSVGGEKDTRQRTKEFEDSGTKDTKEAINRLTKAVRQSVEVVKGLEAGEYKREEQVQGFTMTVLSCIVHVIEHFSYHVGQITFYTKFLKNLDTGYYEGQDLDKRRD